MRARSVRTGLSHAARRVLRRQTPIASFVLTPIFVMSVRILRGRTRHLECCGSWNAPRRFRAKASPSTRYTKIQYQGLPRSLPASHPSGQLETP
jgi:hypothetical protein